MKICELLKAQSGSNLNFLSAVAGSQSAIDNIKAGITAKQLYAAFDGLILAPSKVAEHVETLAAIDCKSLAMLSRDWIDPKDLKSEPTDAREAFWKEAWTASLRHLKRIKAIQRDYVDVPILAHEVSILWDKPQRKTVSFCETAESLIEGFVPYSEIRRLASVGLAEQSLSARDLQHCVERAEISQAPLQLLRLLRGKLLVLDLSARRYIAEILRNFESRHPLEAALLLETALGLGMEVLDELDRKLVQMIPTIEDPEDIEWMVYIICGNNWCVP